MKHLVSFFNLVLVAFTLGLIDHFLLRGNGSIIYAGIAMLGAMDIRTAYANAYRSLLNKATDNGRLDPKLVGRPGGPDWLPNVGNKILSQSDLISEIVLNVNKTTYQFGINVNQQTNSQPIFATERRLNLQDTFYVAQIGYFLRVYTSSGGSNVYRNTLFTHPPAQIYSPLVDLNLMDGLWNGNLNLSINNRTVVPEWDLWRHRETPTSQFPIYQVFNPTGLYPVNDENYGSQSGMMPCEPMWILDGSYDNVMNVTYNDALNNFGIGTSVFHMVVVMRGILAQNCGKIMEPGLHNPA